MLPKICWFKMEFLEGEGLDAAVRSQPTCPVGAAECIQVARSVCAALKVMHSEACAPGFGTSRLGPVRVAADSDPSESQPRRSVASLRMRVCRRCPRRPGRRAQLKAASESAAGRASRPRPVVHEIPVVDLNAVPPWAAPGRPGRAGRREGGHGDTATGPFTAPGPCGPGRQR